MSLRAASAVMRLLRRLLPALERTPTYNAGQMSLFRVGLFELLRPKEAADDWVWITDHTIQVGVQKSLLVVAVRLSTWEAERRPLELHDLRFVALEPVEKSDGAIVHQQLTEMMKTTGIVPRSIRERRGNRTERRRRSIFRGTRIHGSHARYRASDGESRQARIGEGRSLGRIQSPSRLGQTAAGTDPVGPFAASDSPSEGSLHESR